MISLITTAAGAQRGQLKNGAIETKRIKYRITMGP